MIISVWKPKGITSNKLLTQIKKLINIKKVGHAGTLDPLAEGILVVAIGRESTKKIFLEVKKEKEYFAKIKLGEYSTTDDEEGEKEPVKISKIPSLPEVSKVIESFIGEIEQTPPLYSAVKVSGLEAYKYARKGKTVNLMPRKAFIKDIEIINFGFPILELKVTTGPGVYIRSLARDIGKKLKTGGFIKELVRTRVGEHTKENATTLENIPSHIATIN